MKFDKKKLARIVREEYTKIYGPSKDKTVQLTEAQIRRIIREELEECGGMQVDKHGSLSNPAQDPLERERPGGMMSLGMAVGMPQDDMMVGPEDDMMMADELGTEDDLLYGEEY